ncbi:hypothetical protein MRX96_019550 [Rhipicephalus microplus]
MPKDVEDISRVVLLYCLRHYKGLSAPVPRGRKGKKLKNGKGEPDSPDMLADWARDDQYNPDLLLCDDGYRKHLHRHANKVLLRVRLLYYLKHEIIGDLHQQVFAGVPARDIPIPPPAADGEPPAPWWDEDADKSLLIGVYKHGYERFNLMRQDHTLCFLARCGPPDGAALLAEMTANPEDLEDKREEGKKDLDEEEPVSPEPSTSSEAKPPSESSEQVAPTGEQPVPNPAVPTTTVPQVPGEVGTLEFPSPSDLNTRLRRIITMYQRNHKKRELINAQRARRMERREKFEAAIREREIRRLETQQRWSRREEAEFYRAVSCYGVDYRRQEQRFVWDGFRTVGRLERKRDDTLTEYFRAFRAMCRRVCGRKLGEEDENLQYVVEPISEERATRCLQRIELLSKIREEILPHPELDERLKLCQPSMDLPDWWICGRHDKDLLIGAAKYGLSRMDYHLLNDGELSFREVVRAQSASKPPIMIVGHHGHTFPVPTTSVDATMPTILKSSVDNDLEVCPEIAAQDTVVPPPSKDENAVLPQFIDTKVNNSCENEKPAPETPVEAEKSTPGEESVLKVAKKHDEDTVPSEAINAKSEEACSPKVSLQECEMSDKEELSQKSSKHEDNCMKGSIDEEPVQAVKSNDINEVAPVSDKPSENWALKQALLEGSKKEEAVKLGELPLEEPKKSEEKEGIDFVSEMEKEPDKVLSEPSTRETTEGKSLEINDDEAKDELQKTGTTEENQQEQPASFDNSTVQEASSASLGCTPMEMSMSGLVPPPPIIDDDNSKTDVEKTDTEQDPVEIVPSGTKMPLSGFPPFRVLTPQLTEESQETNSQQDDVLSQESFNLDGEGGTEPQVVHFMAHSTRNPVRWPKDKVLQIRLEYIVHAVEKKEWPVPRQGFTLLPATPTECPSSPVASSVASGSLVTPNVAATVAGFAAATVTSSVEMPPVVSVPAGRHSPIPPLPNDDLLIGTRRRRRRRRFEIEAERAKLRALLSHNLQQQQLKQLQQFLAPPSTTEHEQPAQYSSHGYRTHEYYGPKRTSQCGGLSSHCRCHCIHSNNTAAGTP